MPLFRVAVLLLTVVLLTTHAVMAENRVPLVDPATAKTVWSFDYGREFPGATGSLTVDAGRAGSPSLKLVGDFTKGGMYVQAGRKLDKLEIRELSMQVRSPGTERFTLRLGDSSGQTHQIAIKTEASSDWQQISFPLEKFFARRGESDAVTSVAKYESWGGAKDGKWHGPATAIYILLGKPEAGGVVTLELADIAVATAPSAVAGVETTAELPLVEFFKDKHDWRFSNGAEFKGATGSLTVATGIAEQGQKALKLSGDFTAGGAYVAAIKDLSELGVKEVGEIRMKVKSDNAKSVSIQLVDSTGQTHQRKGVTITADGQWNTLRIRPKIIAGGEHWGGAKDGKWHGPPKQLVISLTSPSDPKKQPTLYLADVVAEVSMPVFKQPAAYRDDFEGQAIDGWKVTPGVERSADGLQSAGALKLSRTLESVNDARSAEGPAFAVSPGLWQIELASKAALVSPDNSYSAVVSLQVMDAGGKTVESFTALDQFGKKDWQATTKRFELPKTAATARFRVQLNKTHGDFWLDNLSAAFLSPPTNRDERIDRVLFSTAQLGNLLYPQDARLVQVTVQAVKPLREEQLSATWVVRDYWGAEQTKPTAVTLRETKPGEPKQGKDGLTYDAQIDLSAAPLEVGRYYEVHLSIPQPGGEPFAASTSLAILPEAVTKAYKPGEIPFAARNWDNRIPEYIRLTDRLGIRICGLWAGWSSKPPYKAHAPGLDLVKELGMGWLTTTPITQVELGNTDYTEEALRQGAKNLVEQFGDYKPMIVNLGNEPHGTGDRVLKNVAAYKAVYQAIKAADSSIPVVATSVEPNEEYFKAGYGQWCDAFDFHIYESAENVRRTIQQYQALMKQYDVQKPIWSTELGLNSQGMTRHRVATEVWKKSATFFAAGGTNMTWFALVYPDPDGKSHGSSGNSHNLFDSRYRRYAPRLDAVAWYNAVNAICIKKFVGEKQYADGVLSFLFRDKDGRSLQVMWTETGRADVFVPLAGVEQVEVIRVDGSRRMLSAAKQGITLSATTDPVLILYQGGPESLPEALGKPAATIAAAPEAMSVATPGVVEVRLADATAEVSLVVPPFWTATRNGNGFEIKLPLDTAAHHADLIVQVKDKAGNVRGELYHRATVGR